VQLGLHFKDIDLSAGQISKEEGEECARPSATRPAICCISGYTQHHPSGQSERNAGPTYLKEDIRHARDFGHALLISETGTYKHRCPIGVHHRE